MLVNVAELLHSGYRDLIEICFCWAPVTQILVLGIFGGASCILLWHLWFTTFFPFSRLKVEFRKKRWDFKIDGDGLQYTPIHR